MNSVASPNQVLVNLKVLQDVLKGLSKTPKTLPCKYFYDDVGSRLFDEICDLEEYYLTRTELEIMKNNVSTIVAVFDTPCSLIELGSGLSMKTKLILEAAGNIKGYFPIDISREHLVAASERTTEEFPDLSVFPICADFTQEFQFPSTPFDNLPKIVYFPGSTIGNFHLDEVVTFLQGIGTHLNIGDGLLIGIDLKKSKEILDAAYNDRKGLTAKFNLNILVNINARLNANFNLDQFEHHAFYDSEIGRIEMHLISKIEQKIQINNKIVPLLKGENIWTESSYKYTVEDFEKLAKQAHFKLEQVWLDANQKFSVQYYTFNSG